MDRPGFGSRHPDVAAVIHEVAPFVSMEHEWPGPLPLRINGHELGVQWPDELVLSVRCIVAVADGFVLCTNVDGSHAWPGGRREPGETHRDTARREVYEETGYLVDPQSLVALGWLHYEHLSPMAPGSSWPHPDFVQAVYAGRAVGRERDDWTDTEGYETSSSIVTLDEAIRSMNNPVCAGFMRRAQVLLGRPD